MSETNRQLSAEEWLAFFEQPDVMAMCRTIAMYPHDLTPSYIWLDWLDEHSPDPNLPEMLRETADSEKYGMISSLSKAFDLEIFPWRGRLRFRFQQRHPWQDRLCQCGIVSYLDRASVPFLNQLPPWSINGASFRELTPEDREALFASECLDFFTDLDLDFNNLGNSGVIALANSQYLTNLTSLFLRANDIRRDGAMALVNSSCLANVICLDMNSNSIGDSGATALANSRMVGNLVTLTLWRNGIGSLGAEALAKSDHLNNLTELGLNSNQIDDEGAKALANSPTLANLLTLSLNANQIGFAGAVAFANSAYLTKLENLKLYENHIGMTGAMALASSPRLSETVRSEYRKTQSWRGWESIAFRLG